MVKKISRGGQKLVAVVKKLVAAVKRLVATVEKLVAAWSENQSRRSKN